MLKAETGIPELKPGLLHRWQGIRHQREARLREEGLGLDETLQSRRAYHLPEAHFRARRKVMSQSRFYLVFFKRNTLLFYWMLHGKERRSGLSLLQLHSANAYGTSFCVKLNLRARTSSSFSHTGAKDTRGGHYLLHPRLCNSRKLEAGMEPKMKPKHSNVGELSNHLFIHMSSIFLGSYL